jgi:ABC-type transport system substrate-binding protein
VREETEAGSFLASRFLLDRPPFDDDRVRRAIHLAVDREALMDLVYPPIEGSPSARLSGAVAPVMRRWATTDDDLHRKPGYRTNGGREEDIAEAKRLWSTALGDAPLGPFAIYVAGVPKSIPERALPALQFQLKQTLGVDLVPSVDPSGYALVSSGLGRNLDGASDGVVAFTLAVEDGGVDLDDWLYPYFHSNGAHNTFRLQDSTLDAMLDATRTEFDTDARRQIGLDVQDYLVANVNARLEYAAPVDRRLTWGYVKNSHHPIAAGSNYHLADTWLDSSHPAWAGRKV